MGTPLARAKMLSVMIPEQNEAHRLPRTGFLKVPKRSTRDRKTRTILGQTQHSHEESVANCRHVPRRQNYHESKGRGKCMMMEKEEQKAVGSCAGIIERLNNLNQ